MGVHGLTTLLRNSGLLPPDDDGRCCAGSLWPGTAGGDSPFASTTTAEVLPAGSTLCVDGNGLAFHLLKVAYGRWYGEVLAGGDTPPTAGAGCLCSSVGGGGGGRGKKIPSPTPTQIPSLLPSLLPLSILSTVTSQFVSSLLDPNPHGGGSGGYGFSGSGGETKLRIYFDGPHRRLKSTTDTKRSTRRAEEWDNLKRYCKVGALPSKDGRGRGSRGAKRYSSGGGGGGGGGGGKEQQKQGRQTFAYLESFPAPRLFHDQIRHTLLTYAHRHPDRVSIIDCEEEADGVIAKASADDGTGRTYCVGLDSDFVIFGYEDEDDEEGEDGGAGDDDGLGGQAFIGMDHDQQQRQFRQELDPLDALLHGYYYRYEGGGSNADADRTTDQGAHSSGGRRRGEVQYVPLTTLNASGSHLTGTVLRRSAVVEALNLPDAQALVELSILMGNDYTSEFVRDTKNKGRWAVFVDGCEELDRNDAGSMVAHLAEMPAGYRLNSSLGGFDVAMNFTRALFGFKDVSTFPLDGPTERNELDDDEGGVEEEEKDDDGRPRLPKGFRIGLAEMMPNDGSVAEAVLRALEAYVEEATIDDENNANDASALPVIRREHLDAFRIVCLEAATDDVSGNNSRSRVPTSPPDWNDVLVAQTIERCISVAFRSGLVVSNPVTMAASPHRVFNQASFHDTMEGLMYDDDPLTNEVVTAKEKAFLEEVTSAIPASLSAASATAAGEQQQQQNQQPPPRQVLPIDEYENEIIDTVKDQRVTIIHGETGCGKSSRVPVMLLKAPPPQPTARASSVKMFISQPRRIAAKSLTERVRSQEPDLADSIALRMGHGVREYENPSTRAWFVTTGYLVRLLANHPEKFESHTHLIIDEVHERSVDTDILCLLCRRLLVSHPTIRLILMSATMAAALYTEYFGTPQPPIHVGARRFPIKEYFVEDLAQILHLSHKDSRAAMDVYKDCEAKRCHSVPTNTHIEKLHRLAVQVAMSVGRHGSSVLIFVPGMSDIVSITELIENLCVPGVMYTCFPIHGDIPFEEQMCAFDPPGVGEVKVVIATNSAESSITLPDVDHVVCLGLCKQIIYDSNSHRQMLAPCWISRASATQRAGRTGRVRDGNVYRLYSRDTFHEYMEPYDSGEMTRIPLDSVILSLRDMLQEEVTPILLQCLEPPDISCIDRSFKSLHDSNFITSPNDVGEITSLGSLVVSLGIDLTLGALVGLGIQFGVAAEAIQMAAILSFPKTPWSITNPLYHEIDQYNDITSKTFVSRCHFDANLYSEPFAIMNLVWDYSRADRKDAFCRHYSVSNQRLRRLVTTIDSLQGRVAERKGIHREVLCLQEAPRKMPHAKLTVLRVLQVWLFSDAIIECRPASKFLAFEDTPLLSLCGPQIEEELLDTVLDRKRHPFTMESRTRIEHRGHFTPVEENAADAMVDFEARFISFAVENGFKIMWHCYGHALRLFVSFDVVEEESSGVEEALESLFGDSLGDCVYFEKANGTNRRGRKGRACGLWTETNAEGKDAGGKGTATLVMYSYRLKPKQMRDRHKRLNKAVRGLEGVSKFISCFVEETSSKKSASRTNFTIAVGGLSSEIPRQDLQDLFSTPEVSFNTQTNYMPQTIRFGLKPNAPMDPSQKFKIRDDAGEAGDQLSWHRPLLTDVPEGARLLAVLASGRRRDHFLRFSICADDDQEDKAAGEDSEYVDVALTGAETKAGLRWQRLGSNSVAYVPENSTPAVAVSTEGDEELFACCANTLELKGGAVRAEGLTLLPPGRLFLLLSFLSFGMRPFMSWSEDEEKKDDEELLPTSEMLDWLKNEDWELSIPRDVEDRIVLALKLNRDCRGLGEELVCFPEKVEALCKVFTGIDGFVSEPWDGLYQDALIHGQTATRAVPRKSRTYEGGPATAPTRRITPKKTKHSTGEVPSINVTSPTIEESPGANKMGKATKAYGCLGCGVRHKKWKMCKDHMRQCCPDLVRANENSKLLKMCVIGGSECESPPKLPKPEPSKPEPKATKAYGCLGCGIRHKKWKMCKDHMKECCPDRTEEATVSLKKTLDASRIVLGPAHPTTKQYEEALATEEAKQRGSRDADEDLKLMKMCLIGGSECQAPPEPRKPEPKATKAYGCLGCGIRYKKWKMCKEHMKDCCPDKLREANFLKFKLIDLCLIGSDRCLVPESS